jgi:hypothetical protein
MNEYNFEAMSLETQVVFNRASTANPEPSIPTVFLPFEEVVANARSKAKLVCAGRSLSSFSLTWSPLSLSLSSACLCVCVCVCVCVYVRDCVIV